MSKKTSLFLLLLMSMSFVSKAQFSFGIKGGINVNKFVTSAAELSNPEVKYTPVGGVFARFGIQSFSVTPEVMFSTKNSGFSVDKDSLKVSFYLNYIDVPLMLGFHILAFNVQTGPVLGILLNQKTEISDFGKSFNTTMNDELFNNINVAWQAGIGIDLFRFMLNIRYEFGLGQFINEFTVPDKNITLKPDGRSSAFQFTLGYKLVKK